MHAFVVTNNPILNLKELLLALLFSSTLLLRKRQKLSILIWITSVLPSEHGDEEILSVRYPIYLDGAPVSKSLVLLVGGAHAATLLPALKHFFARLFTGKKCIGHMPLPCHTPYTRCNRGTMDSVGGMKEHRQWSAGIQLFSPRWCEMQDATQKSLKLS